MSDEITIPKSVLQDVFDIATSSLDFGSGFLNDSEQDSLIEAARAIGVDPMTAVMSQKRCAFRAKLAGLPEGQLTHQLCDWYTDPYRKVRTRYCRDCSGAREEEPVLLPREHQESK